MIDPRDRLVIGAPGGFSNWTFNRLRSLARHARPGPFEILHRKLKEPVPPRPADSHGRILMTHFPRQEIVDALASMPELRVVYIDEPPEQVMKYLVETQEFDVMRALRFATGSYTAHRELAARFDVPVLSCAPETSVKDYLTTVSDLLDLAVPPATVAYIAKKTSVLSIDLSPLEAAAVREFPAARRGPIPNRVAAARAGQLLAAILEPLSRRRLDAGTCTIRLPGDVFNIFDPKDANGSFGPDVDLPGPKRILLHGPRLHLPRARISARFTNVCEGLSPDQTFRIEVLAAKQRLASVRYRPGRLRQFVGEFAFEHRNVDQRLQIQTIMERGAIQGRLTLVEITLSLEQLEPIDPVSSAPAAETSA